MRLIDADALVAEIVKIDDLRKLSTATIGKALDAVPTVDAIPVEWLRKQGQHGSIIQLSATILIEKWQKEQEVRI